MDSSATLDTIQRAATASGKSPRNTLRGAKVRQALSAKGTKFKRATPRSVRNT